MKWRFTSGDLRSMPAFGAMRNWRAVVAFLTALVLFCTSQGIAGSLITPLAMARFAEDVERLDHEELAEELVSFVGARRVRARLSWREDRDRSPFSVGDVDSASKRRNARCHPPPIIPGRLGSGICMRC